MEEGPRSHFKCFTKLKLNSHSKINCENRGKIVIILAVFSIIHEWNERKE